jgi:DNA end-binding protein Ku
MAAAQAREKASHPKNGRRAKGAAPSGVVAGKAEGEMRRALWSGAISFGLLQIPVTLRTAEQQNELHFHQLDKHDKSQIKYERVNASTGKTVAWSDIVRGYEYAPGKYVVVDDDDFKAANVEATQTIDLQDFVDLSAISPAFFETPYFVSAGKHGEKAYALFRDALDRKKVAAIGMFVLRTRQRICALYADGKTLRLEILRFAHELRAASGAGLPSGAYPRAKTTARELAMAEDLVESMRAEWEPDKYKDTYRDELLALIEKKAKTGKVDRPPQREPQRTNVVDLMSLLKRSIEEKGKGARPANASKGVKSSKPLKRKSSATEAA